MKIIGARALAALALLTLAGLLGGCGLAELAAYPFASRKAERQVVRQYELRAERLLILPYADSDLMFDYPGLDSELAGRVQQQLYANLEGQVKVINPAWVTLYQQNNLDWMNKHCAQVAREFKADKVMYLELRDFSLNESGSANLFRGRATIHMQIFDAAALDKDAPLYETNVTVMVPRDRPLSSTDTNPVQVRQITARVLAEELVWKFYDHKEEVLGQ